MRAKGGNMTLLDSSMYMASSEYQALGSIADFSDVLQNFRQRSDGAWQRFVCWFVGLVCRRR